ncbi:MAG: hypothetical protein KGJ13_11275 [Patescibacteria group bacterium]|nr:hypothetical protein [Patescibacteria group bacterium]
MEEKLLPEHASPDVPQKKYRRWPLRLLSILYGLLVFPGLGIAVSGVFAFDAPGSEKVFTTQLFALSLLIVPFVLIVSCIGGLIVSFGKRTPRRVRWVWIFALLPALNLVLFLIAIALLQGLCGGSFTCTH